MRIELYFQQIRETVETCLIVQSSNITYDKRGTHAGFAHGELYFADGSTLHLREFVDVETHINRLMYVYQYMSATKTLVFRYDNTGHHKKLNLPTYPHHKHEGTQDQIIPSSAPDLAAVLIEIERLIQLP
ncbi:MAG: hypothetical protein HC875_24190 [Anaerolineales bacterium]|nr:hypothetical protein [Anaerolineales bacterium]